MESSKLWSWSVAGSKIFRIIRSCTKMLEMMKKMPRGMPQISMVPISTPSGPATAIAATPGTTISRPTSRPMASEPARVAMLLPVRLAMAPAIGARMTRATSK